MLNLFVGPVSAAVSVNNITFVTFGCNIFKWKEDFRTFSFLAKFNTGLLTPLSHEYDNCLNHGKPTFSDLTLLWVKNADWTQLQLLILTTKLSYRPEPYFTQVLIFRFLNPSKRLPTCVICYEFQVASVECKARTFLIRSCCFNLMNLTGVFLGFEIIRTNHLNVKAAISLRKQLIKVSSHN